MSGIPLVLDRGLLAEGIGSYIEVDFDRHPHALIAGPTGSGKSYLDLLFLGKIVRYIPGARLYILDFKHSDDFSFLSGIPNARYFAYTNCEKGLQQFNAEFEARLQGAPDRTPLYMLFDEYTAYLNYAQIRDKKLAEAQKLIFSNLLFLGRSFNVHLLCSVQRPDSSYLVNGAREQFGICIGLGTLSSEAAVMLFGESAKKQIQPCGVGAGYMAIDGERLYAAQVPIVRHLDTLRQAIACGATR